MQRASRAPLTAAYELGRGPSSWRRRTTHGDDHISSTAVRDARTGAALSRRAQAASGSPENERRPRKPAAQLDRDRGTNRSHQVVESCPSLQWCGRRFGGAEKKLRPWVRPVHAVVLDEGNKKALHCLHVSPPSERCEAPGGQNWAEPDARGYVNRVAEDADSRKARG